MTKRVLKYLIGINRIPEKHRFLHAGRQHQDYMMWLEVDESSINYIPNPYTLVPTGLSDVPDGAAHKITFIDHHNSTVWHVYDKRGHVIFHNKGDSEATFVADGNDACFACGGSGHTQDVKGVYYRAEDINRHVRRLDVLLNGEEGVAKQALLIDIVAQVEGALVARGQRKLL